MFTLLYPPNYSYDKDVFTYVTDTLIRKSRTTTGVIHINLFPCPGTLWSAGYDYIVNSTLILLIVALLVCLFCFDFGYVLYSIFYMILIFSLMIFLIALFVYTTSTILYNLKHFTIALC